MRGPNVPSPNPLPSRGEGGPPPHRLWPSVGPDLFRADGCGNGEPRAGAAGEALAAGRASGVSARGVREIMEGERARLLGLQNE